MKRIRKLPPEVVDRIAAGEVVERPASVVKELIENSIDAGATRIIVELEDGGRDLIAVTDNGSGIAPEDLPLAFESHATSKLEAEVRDWSSLGVKTLGFRGEALASIASVARVEVLTRSTGEEHGYRYRPGHAQEPGPIPAAAPQGTSIRVRSLFHNTPGRRKFLKSTQAELAQAVQQVTRLALSCPGLSFRLLHGGRTILELGEVDGLEARIEQLIGKGAFGDLLEVRGADVAGRSVMGMVSRPGRWRRDTQGQHLFVNGRWVRDRTLAHALRSAFQGFQVPGKHPIAYLLVELPPEEVDVNVHPTKTEVRFRDSSEVYRLVYHSLRAALEAEPGGSRGGEPAGAAPPAQEPSGVEPEGEQGGLKVIEDIKAAAQEFLRSDRGWGLEPRAQPRGPGSGGGPAAPPRSWDRAAAQEGVGRRSLQGHGALLASALRPAGEAASLQAFQLLQTYLVVEVNDEVRLFDQHALHEKILFERLLLQVQAGRRESQGLLVPIVLELTPVQMAILEDVAAELRPFGFELEAFGPGAAALQGYPAILGADVGEERLGAIVRAVFDTLLTRDSAIEGLDGSFHGVLYRVAATLACKRAVKAGQRLSPREIGALLESIELTRDPRFCPHGRPTSVVLTRRDLDRMFDRR